MRIKILPSWKVKRQSKVNWRNKGTEFTKLSWRKKRRSVFLDPTYEWERTMFIFLWRISLSMISPKVHPFFVCMCVEYGRMSLLLHYIFIYMYIYIYIHTHKWGGMSEEILLPVLLKCFTQKCCSLLLEQNLGKQWIFLS